MGFRRRKTLGLMFDGDLTDLEWTVTALTIDEWLNLCELTAGGLEFLPANRERIDQVRDLLMEHTVEWSLDDDQGDPLPVGLEGFVAQDMYLQAAVIDAWTTQMVRAPVPLGEPSTPGPLDLVPMDPPDQASQAS